MTPAGRTPWRALALLALVLYLVLPVRLVWGRVAAQERRVGRLHDSTAVIERRTAVARRADRNRLAADLDAVALSMPTGGIEPWIDSVSAVARATGTTWRSGAVTPPAGAVQPGEPAPTTVSVVAEGPTPAVLAFVDQLRTVPRLTLVDAFALTADPKDSRRASASLTLRLLSFVPADPAPPATV